MLEKQTWIGSLSIKTQQLQIFYTQHFLWSRSLNLLFSLEEGSPTEKLWFMTLVICDGHYLVVFWILVMIFLKGIWVDLFQRKWYIQRL